MMAALPPIRPLLVSGCAAILLAGCVIPRPPDGTPYIDLHTPGGLFYADTSLTYYADGTWSYSIAAFPDGSGPAERTSGTAPGAYEAALAAIAQPTAQELANARATQQTNAAPEPHDAPIEICTHFDGMQTRVVALYVCTRASMAAQ